MLISIKSRKLPLRQIWHFLIGWSFNGNLFLESSAATIFVCFLNFPVTQASQESCSWLPSSEFGHYLIYSKNDARVVTCVEDPLDTLRSLLSPYSASYGCPLSFAENQTEVQIVW